MSHLFLRQRFWAASALAFARPGVRRNTWYIGMSIHTSQDEAVGAAAIEEVDSSFYASAYIHCSAGIY